MKLLFSIFSLLFSTFILAQEGIRFEEGSFSEILKKAKDQKKLVFLDAYAAWCGPCKLMEKNIFSLKTVGEYYNSNFINAHFDMEKGEGRDIAKQFAVRSYPTYLFLNGNGEVVLKNYGYMSEEDFITIAKEANNPENLKNSPKARFENGDSDPQLLLNLMQQNAQTDFEFAKKVSERYFATKKAQDFTKDDVGMLFYFTRSSDDKNFKIIDKNKEAITKYIGENVYNEFKNSLKISKIMEATIDDKTKTINEDYYFKNAVPLVGKEEATKALNRVKVNFYPMVNDFAKYETAALNYYQDADQFDPNELLKAAWIFSEHITNPESLKKAREWAEKSVMKSESPENTYILAKLYQKSGNKDLAIMYAETSKNLAETNNTDATAAYQLLKELQ